MSANKNVERLGLVFRTLRQKEQEAYNIINSCEENLGTKSFDMSVFEMKHVCQNFFSKVLNDIRRALSDDQFYDFIEFNSNEWDDEIDVCICTFDGFEYGNNPVRYGAKFWRSNSDETVTRRYTIKIDDTSISFCLALDKIEYSNYQGYYLEDNLEATLKKERYSESIEICFYDDVCLYSCEDLIDEKFKDNWFLVPAE